MIANNSLFAIEFISVKTTRIQFRTQFMACQKNAKKSSALPTH